MAAKQKSKLTAKRDLARFKTVRRSIANSKNKKLPSSCDAFVRDIENAMDAADMIKSVKVRRGAKMAAEKAAERGIKAGCFRGRMDPF